MGGKKSVFFVFCRGSPGKYLFPSGVFEKLNRSFGFSKHIGRKHVIGEEVDKGHFGHTCRVRCKKGVFKGQQFAVKIISKSKLS
ncbi:hypothetical protein R6Q59_019348 [Mikania micrantha]